MVAASPTAAQTRTFLIFFNWNKADLTPRGRKIAAAAAHAYKVAGASHVTVNGYTGTAGNPALNLKLSYRRAGAVAAALVADGVPKQAITVQGFGETHLLVPTGPGVRELQNRRVEILLR